MVQKSARSGHEGKEIVDLTVPNGEHEYRRDER